MGSARAAERQPHPPGAERDRCECDGVSPDGLAALLQGRRLRPFFLFVSYCCLKRDDSAMGHRWNVRE